MDGGIMSEQKHQQEDGYSDAFWIMLVIGIVGFIGFCIVAAGS